MTDIEFSKERFIAFLDVLGFRNLLRTHGTNNLAELYANAIEESQTVINQTHDEVCLQVPIEYAEDGGFPGSWDSFAEPQVRRVSLFPRVERIAIFSDSIFVFGASDTIETLNDVIYSTLALFRVFLRSGLPLAGAIAKGDAVVSPDRGVYLGGGIVSAYDLANSIDIVGVVVHADVPQLDQLMSKPTEVQRKKRCGKRAGPLCLRVPMAREDDRLLAHISADWKVLVQNQTSAAKNEGKEAKWKHSSQILGILLDTEISNS